jgi:hypothetical protein
MLLNYRQTNRLRPHEPKISSFQPFRRAKTLGEKYSLDLSDALQIVDLAHGEFSHYGQDSKSVLITVDGDVEKPPEAKVCAFGTVKMLKLHLSNETYLRDAPPLESGPVAVDQESVQVGLCVGGNALAGARKRIHGHFLRLGNSLPQNRAILRNTVRIRHG